MKVSPAELKRFRDHYTHKCRDCPRVILRHNLICVVCSFRAERARSKIALGKFQPIVPKKRGRR